LAAWIASLTLVFWGLPALAEAGDGAPVAQGTYSIHTGAFKNLDHALREVNRLEKAGYHAFHTATPGTGKGQLYAVYVGDFSTREGAEEKAHTLKGYGLIGSYLIHPSPSRGTEGAPANSPSSTRGSGGRTAAMAKKRPTAQRALSSTVQDIVLTAETETEEVVVVRADSALHPKVFSLQGAKPRLVVDIPGASGPARVPPGVTAESRLVQGIRTHFHREKQTLRIVLDLSPSRNFAVTPTLLDQGKNLVLQVDAVQGQEGKGQILLSRLVSGSPPMESAMEDKGAKQLAAKTATAALAFSKGSGERGKPIQTRQERTESAGMRENTPPRGEDVGSRAGYAQAQGTAPTAGMAWGGRGRNAAPKTLTLGLRHRFLDLETKLTGRKAVASDGATKASAQVPLQDIDRRSFPTSMHTDTLHARFGLTDYLEAFADLGVTYHDTSDLDVNPVYGAGLRLNLLEAGMQEVGTFYAALIGEYLGGKLHYDYTSDAGVRFRKEADWRKASASTEFGLVRYPFAGYLGATGFIYREDTEREQLDLLPAGYASFVFEDELEERNGYNLYGGVQWHMTPKASLNLEGQVLNHNGLSGAFAYEF